MNYNNNFCSIIKNKENTLFENFYIFGLDYDLILSDYLYNVKNYSKENNKIFPVILNKFPSYINNNSYINDNVLIEHIFPNGFKIIEKIEKPKNEFFYFNLMSLNGKNIFFSCLLFYESLFQYYNFKKNYNENKIVEINIEEFNHNFTKNIIKNDKILNKSFDLEKSENIFLKENILKYIFIPKVICLSSLFPYIFEKKYILKSIFKYSLKNNIKIPLETIIENFFKIPLPKNNILYSNQILFGQNNKLFIRKIFLNKNFIPSLPKINIIFEEFKIKNILEILKCIILEIPLLFFSENKYKLSIYINIFLSLIFPLEYVYPNVIILPKINYYLIEIKKCFVFGINQKYNKNFFKDFNLNIYNKYIKIVDLDNSCLTEIFNKNENIIKFKNLFNNNLNVNNNSNNNFQNNNYNYKYKINLIEHYTLKLEKKLKNFFDKNKKKEKKISNNKNNNNNIEYNYEFIENIYEIFLYYFVCILLNYTKFLYNDEKSVLEIIKKIKKNKFKIDEIFKINEFLNNIKNVDSNFYKCFFHTKIFKNFIKNKYLLNSAKLKIKYLIFDENIIYKRNKNIFYKKININFINSKFLSSNKITEINFYYENNNNNKINNNKKFFFPKLNFNKIEILFNNNEKEDNNNNFNISKINKIFSNYISIYSKDKLNNFIFDSKNYIFENEMINYIYLLWLYFFSLTFYYLDENEKIFRFFEMINNLSKLNYYSSKLFNYIFLSLYFYGNEFMLFKFLDFFPKSKNYIFYDYLTNKIKTEKKSLIKKFSISSTSLNFYSYENNINDEYILNLPNEENIKFVNKRIFNNNLNEIKFKEYFYCNKCKKKINIIDSISKLGKNKNNKYFFCLFCNSEINPFIIVDNKMKIEIYNSYYLYKICKNIFILYGIKLDIENFQKEFNNNFYNLIWYFSVFGLNYDFLLKYNDNNNLIKNNNEINNKNYDNLKNYIQKFVLIRENVNNFTI